MTDLTSDYQRFMTLPVAEREAISYKCFLKEIAGYSQEEQEKLKEEYNIVHIKMLKYQEDINEKKSIFEEVHPDLEKNELPSVFISGNFRVFWIDYTISLNPNLIKY
jgi:hypothetical protein